jgi:anti-sigma regulatory factor (Ser/Thr protein kinase)
MDVELHLAPDRRAPALARGAVDRLVGQVSAPVLDDLRLVVSELVTNAIVHGPRREPVTLRLSVTGPDRVAGEVADQGDGGAVEVRESAGDGGGWGLRLLDRVSDRWGVHEGSTHVWFELSGRDR